MSLCCNPPLAWQCSDLQIKVDRAWGITCTHIFSYTCLCLYLYFFMYSICTYIYIHIICSFVTNSCRQSVILQPERAAGTADHISLACVAKP